jgi:hypothetical protein
MDLIELDATHAVEIVLCGNAETVCDGTELSQADSVTKEEATTAACEAANEVIWKHLHGFGSAANFFADWHGGKHCRADLSGGIAVANLFSRDDCYGDWEWCEKKGFPADLIAKVQAAIDDADVAARAALAEVVTAYHVPSVD